MSSLAPALLRPKVLPPLPIAIHRFTVAQYHRMIATGLLTEEDRVELLEGWIVDKMPQHPAHASSISILLARLQTKLPKGWIVRVQSPITLEDSEPEPDLAIVTGPEEKYRAAHPALDDLALIIEVADTSLENDRGSKMRMYAGARVPVYWIVNLNERHIEVYTEPKGGKSPAYRRRADVAIDGKIPLILNGKEMGQISVLDLFPPQAVDGNKG